METIEKIDVKQMKADIKKMVEEQKSYRLQRKYKLPEGMERTISQSEAQWKHRANRQKLRPMVKPEASLSLRPKTNIQKRAIH
jgi:hypothetical protein